MKNKWDQKFYWFNSSETWFKEKLRYILEDDNEIFTMFSGSTFNFFSITDEKDCDLILITLINLSANPIETFTSRNLYRFYPDTNEIELIHTFNYIFDLTILDNKLWTLSLDVETSELRLNEYNVTYKPEFILNLNKFFIADMDKIGDQHYPFNYDNMLILLSMTIGSFFTKDDKSLLFFTIKAENESTSSALYEIDITGESGSLISYKELFNLCDGDEYLYMRPYYINYYNSKDDLYCCSILFQYGDSSGLFLYEFDSSGNTNSGIEFSPSSPIGIPCGLFKYNGGLKFLLVSGLTMEEEFLFNIGELSNGSIQITDYDVFQFSGFNIPHLFQNCGCIDIRLPEFQNCDNIIYTEFSMNEDSGLFYDIVYKYNPYDGGMRLLYVNTPVPMLSNMKYAFYGNKTWTFSFDFNTSDLLMFEYITTYHPIYKRLLNRTINLSTIFDPMMMLMLLTSGFVSFYSKDENNLVFSFTQPLEEENTNLYVVNINITNEDNPTITPLFLFDMSTLFEPEEDMNMYLITGDGYYNKTFNIYVFSIGKSNENNNIESKLIELNSNGELINFIDNYGTAIKGFYNYLNELYCYSILSSFEGSQSFTGNTYKITSDGLIFDKMIFSSPFENSIPNSFNQHPDCIDILLPIQNSYNKILLTTQNFEINGFNLFEYDKNTNSFEYLYTYDNNIRMAFDNKKLWALRYDDILDEYLLDEYIIDYDAEFTSILNRTLTIQDQSLFMGEDGLFFAKNNNEVITSTNYDDIISIIKLNLSGNIVQSSELFSIPFYPISGYYNKALNRYVFNVQNENDGYQIIEYSEIGELITSIELNDPSNIITGFFQKDNKLYAFNQSFPNEFGEFTEKNKISEITGEGLVYIYDDIDLSGFTLFFHQNPGSINIPLPTPPMEYINNIKTFDGVNFLTLNNQTWGWGYNYNNSLGVNSNDIFVIDPLKVCGEHVFSKIETYYYNMGLDILGNLWGWGYNYNGQLGNNSYDLTITPKKVHGNNEYTDFLISNGNTISLDKDGNVWEWGIKYIDYKKPNKINGDKSFISINLIKYYYAIALDNNNKAWAWGEPLDISVLGTTEEYKNSPLEVQGNHIFCKILTNEQGSIGIDNNNQAWTWGINDIGQLGLGDNINRSTPVMISNHTFIDIYKQNKDGFRLDITFAKDNNNILWGWGYNQQGGLGIGSYLNKFTPTEIHGNHIFNDVYYQYGTVYAVDDSGKTWVWGNNNYGKSGTGFIGTYNSPMVVYGDHIFTKFYIQKYHTIGIDDSGQTWAWGYNLYGQLGVGDTISRITPVLIHSSPNFIKIYTSQTNTLAFDTNNNLWGWGSPNIIEDNTFVFTPKLIFTGHTFKEIYISSDQSSFAIAIDDSGQTWSWGLNNLGQLGLGDNISRSTPTLIRDKSFENIIIEQHLILGLDTNKNLWFWGYSNNLNVNSNSPIKLNSIRYNEVWNSEYGLRYVATDESGLTWIWGYGNNQPIEYNRKTPFKINVNETIKNIAGSNEARFIYNDNRSWSWGNNYYGETGTGLISIIESPVEIYGNHTFCKIFNNIYSNTVFAIDNHNITWGWGGNNIGQLGIGVVNCHVDVVNTPMKICGDHTFNNIKTRNMLTIGLDHNGQLWGWGNNYDGNLGLGDYDNKCTPVLIQNHTFCDIFLYDNYSMSIDQNNSLWGWGNNYYGQLGCGDYDDKNTPVSVLGNHTFCEISLDYGKVIAIDNNNEVWGWGYKMAAVPVIPVKINNTSFCDIKIDSSSVFGLDNNGKLWVWGDNRGGQLGINNTENQFVPIDIQGHNFCKIYLMSETGKN